MNEALLAAALLLAGATWTERAPTARLQEPVLSIRAVPDSAYRPRVRISGLLRDASLQDAARSGLPLRVRVRVELWRDGWVDNLVASQTWTSVLLYDPVGLDWIVRLNPNRPNALRFPSYDAARAAIERDFLLPIQPRRDGKYYYTATLELETLSLSDLEELERWLQGELQPAVTGGRSIPGAVGQGAKRLMIRLLALPTRRIEARSERFTI